MTEDNRPLPYSLRLEPEIRARLEAIAKTNGRSLNAEIALRLEASLQEDASQSIDKQLLTTEKVRFIAYEIALKVVREELAKSGK